MAKIYGLFGAMTGKVADVVMVVRNGVQVARKYQPVVSNPSSPAQVASRARLKLLSQLAHVMASVIAMSREGIVSARNLFVKSNYPDSQFSNNTASINLAGIKLTNGVLSFPAVTGSATASSISVALSQAVEDITKVVYAIFRKEADGTLRLIRTSVISEASDSGLYPYSPSVTGGGNFLVLAYGIRENTERARTTFGDMQVLTAETVAKLIATRTLTKEDVSLTETKGLEFASA